MVSLQLPVKYTQLPALLVHMAYSADPTPSPGGLVTVTDPGYRDSTQQLSGDSNPRVDNEMPDSTVELIEIGSGLVMPRLYLVHWLEN